MQQINPSNKELDAIIENHSLERVNVFAGNNETYINGDKRLFIVCSPCGSYRKVFINFEIIG